MVTTLIADESLVHAKARSSFYPRKKLAILKEGEKNGVSSVCAKYGISDQSYRAWRYQASGIQPRKQFSTEEKLQILEEAYQNGIEQVCAAYRISPRTYYRWKKLDFTKSLRRSFTEKEQLLIVEDAIRNGISTASKEAQSKWSQSPRLGTAVRAADPQSGGQVHRAGEAPDSRRGLPEWDLKSL